MISIYIRDTDKCDSAVAWCGDHITNNSWSIATQWPAVGLVFKFDDPATATLFSLKWAGNN